MMVMRPQSPFKTPPTSRGTSPNRTQAPRRSTEPQGPGARRAGASPTRRTGVSPTRRTGVSPVRKASPDTGRNTREPKAPATGPEKKRPLVRSFSDRSIGSNSPQCRKAPGSRGSETGSIDRLDDTGNLTRIITSFGNAEDNINVVVRVRPLSIKEKKYSNGCVVEFPGNGQILCDGVPGGPGGGQKPRLFSFNVVFEPAATQADVLEYSGIKRLIDMAVEGFSCTAFCYGQTGSGKTHTLTGPPGLIDKFVGKSEDHGLIVRSFNYLFRHLQNLPGTNFILKASFLEIYNEKVIDLLNGSSRKPLAVRWSKKQRGFFVENLFTVECEELDDLIAVLEEGMRNRSVGSHSMNDYSSRSHTILTVHIHSEQPAEGGVFISKHGKINFVDLAGSEMTKKTHSEGKTLEEANNINKSLMVLGYCIASLSDSKKKSGHIPYRDSKLTKLLADSLAGNGVTLMIACVSPAKSNLSETVNTLRYAARAKKIRTKPIVIMDPREALILTLKREVGSLKIENDRLRSVLHLNGEPATYGSPSKNANILERRPIETPPRVDLEKLAELEGGQLAELVRLYLRENEALRRDNEELYTTRDLVMRDQDLLSRENERLLKKLEDVNMVCCRSPIIPARPTLSAEMLSKSNGDLDLNSSIIFTDSDKREGRVSVKLQEEHIPDAIQKELEKRRIGNSIGEPSRRPGSHRRHNSWDGRSERSSDGNSSGHGGHRHNQADSADSVTHSHRRARMQATNTQQAEGTKPATERRNNSPNRRFSFANPNQSIPASNTSASSVLPDREHFTGRSRAQERSAALSFSESLLSDTLSRFSTADSTSHVTTATSDVKSAARPRSWQNETRQANPLDTSCLSVDNEKNVFGSIISVDEDDDDLVFSNVK